jgi:hypothetical protein
MRLPSTRPTTPSWHQAKGRIAAFLRRQPTQIELQWATMAGRARLPPSQANQAEPLGESDLRR